MDAGEGPSVTSATSSDQAQAKNDHRPTSQSRQRSFIGGEQQQVQGATMEAAPGDSLV